MIADKLVVELERQVNEYGYVDVGSGVEDIYCISCQKLNHVLSILRGKGYFISIIDVKPGIHMKVLSKKPITKLEIDEHREEWVAHRKEIKDLYLRNDILRKMVMYHLQDFDVTAYHDDNPSNGIYPERGREMLFCSMLIRNMILKGATTEEIADSIKYSMVVIDSEKKHLNVAKAGIDFGIEDKTYKYLPNWPVHRP